MKSALRNPRGLPVGASDEGVIVVRVGEEGEFTHIYNPVTKAHLCRSGIKHGKVPPLFASKGSHVTCYRCAKLAAINLKASGGQTIFPRAA
jgi:hypothetical protein